MKAKKTTHKKASTNAGDRESRLREILGASGSAEEALLKQAAHFDLLGNAESAEMASQEMVKVRVSQQHIDLKALPTLSLLDCPNKRMIRMYAICV